MFFFPNHNMEGNELWLRKRESERIRWLSSHGENWSPKQPIGRARRLGKLGHALRKINEPMAGPHPEQQQPRKRQSDQRQRPMAGQGGKTADDGGKRSNSGVGHVSAAFVSNSTQGRVAAAVAGLLGPASDGSCLERKGAR